jgi:hypothetical protein
MENEKNEESKRVWIVEKTINRIKNIVKITLLSTEQKALQIEVLFFKIQEV